MFMAEPFVMRVSLLFSNSFSFLFITFINLVGGRGMHYVDWILSSCLACSVLKFS